MRSIPMSFEQVAKWAGVDPVITASARLCEKPRIVVSGRLASGKDTVAAEIMRILGFPDAVRVSIASPLRDEVNAVLDMVRDNEPLKAVARISDYGKLSADSATQVRFLADRALLEDPGVTSYTRTAAMRALLQHWGTDVRMAEDPLYWTRRAVLNVFSLMSADSAIFVTDARFVGDIDMMHAVGFCSIRLETSPAVRAERLFDRDGIHMDAESGDHNSETALDAYENFDLSADNSGSLSDTVSGLLWQMSQQPAFR